MLNRDRSSSPNRNAKRRHPNAFNRDHNRLRRNANKRRALNRVRCNLRRSVSKHRAPSRAKRSLRRSVSPRDSHPNPSSQPPDRRPKRDLPARPKQPTTQSPKVRKTARIQQVYKNQGGAISESPVPMGGRWQVLSLSIIGTRI